MHQRESRGENNLRKSASADGLLPVPQFEPLISRQQRLSLLERLDKIIHAPFTLPPEQVFTDYRFGIEHALKDRRIIEFPFYREPDDHAHFWNHTNTLQIEPTNSRSLTRIGEALCHICSNERDACVLDLGAGSGVVASQISRLVPKAELHTVGLTPINPYLRFRDPPVSFRGWAGNDPTILEKIFEKCPIPFIAHQQITEFPRATALPYHNYHLVHDLYGPVFHYNTNPFRQSSSIQVAEGLVELLHPRGIIYIAEISPSIFEPLKTAITRLDEHACIRKVVEGNLNGIIAARGDAAIVPFLNRSNASVIDADALTKAIF